MLSSICVDVIFLFGGTTESNTKKVHCGHTHESCTVAIQFEIMLNLVRDVDCYYFVDLLYFAGLGIVFIRNIS